LRNAVIIARRASAVKDDLGRLGFGTLFCTVAS